MQHYTICMGKERTFYDSSNCNIKTGCKDKQNVLSYLNGMSIEDASVWMDEMKMTANLII